MLKKQIKKNNKTTRGDENIENLLKKQTAVILDIMDKRFEVIDQKFEAVDKRFEVIDQKFEAVDKRFEVIDQKFEAVDKRFEVIDQKFEAVDKRFEVIDQKFEAVDKRFDMVDRKILKLEDTMNSKFEEMETKESQRFDRIMANFDKLLKRTVDTDDEIEFIKLDINRIKAVVKEKLGVNLI